MAYPNVRKRVPMTAVALYIHPFLAVDNTRPTPLPYSHSHTQYMTPRPRSEAQDAYRTERTSHSPQSPTHPPPLIVARPVPLPALTAGPISLHPILAHHRRFAAAPLLYDLSLPPSTAKLAPFLNSAACGIWRVQPATGPQPTTSMTLRFAGCKRPIVVFPARLEDDVVTAADVLQAVYHALLSETAESGYAEFKSKRATMSAIRRRLGGPTWWAGLEESNHERDVWVLHAVTVVRR